MRTTTVTPKVTPGDVATRVPAVATESTDDLPIPRDVLEADRLTVLRVAREIPRAIWDDVRTQLSNDGLRLIAHKASLNPDSRLNLGIRWGTLHIGHHLESHWRQLLIEQQRQLRGRAIRLGIVSANAEELLGDHASALALNIDPDRADVRFILDADARMAELADALLALEECRTRAQPETAAPTGSEPAIGGGLAVNDMQLELF